MKMPADEKVPASQPLASVQNRVRTVLNSQFEIVEDPRARIFLGFPPNFEARNCSCHASCHLFDQIARQAQTTKEL